MWYKRPKEKSARGKKMKLNGITFSMQVDTRSDAILMPIKGNKLELKKKKKVITN